MQEHQLTPKHENTQNQPVRLYSCFLNTAHETIRHQAITLGSSEHLGGTGRPNTSKTRAWTFTATITKCEKKWTDTNEVGRSNEHHTSFTRFWNIQTMRRPHLHSGEPELPLLPNQDNTRSVPGKTHQYTYRHPASFKWDSKTEWLYVHDLPLQFGCCLSLAQVQRILFAVALFDYLVSKQQIHELSTEVIRCVTRDYFTDIFMIKSPTWRWETKHAANRTWIWLALMQEEQTKSIKNGCTWTNCNWYRGRVNVHMVAQSVISKNVDFSTWKSTKTGRP